MATYDPLERQIRQRAHSMRRTPSTQAWSRVERRLDRTGRTGVLGLRPWMIAALFLVVAGVLGLGLVLTEREASPLAQRSESVEDLGDAFAPVDNFDVEEYREWLQSEDTSAAGRTPRPADFRDLTVAKKYRS